MRLDKRATMKAYKARVQAVPTETVRAWFDGKWMSSFAIRCTISAGRPVSTRFRKQYPVQAYLIALEKGATPLGLTTEHKISGRYVCQTRRTLDPGDVRYIGKYSHFSGHLLRRQDNPFALQPEDKRYIEQDDRPVCLAYNLRRSSSMCSST